MPSLRSWLPLIVALVLNAAANVLLKLGAAADRTATEGGSAVARAAGFLNLITLSAIALFGLNILFYRKALEALPLSVAYPLMLSGSLILATLGARALPQLAEKITALQALGLGVIVLGVWMVARD